MTQSPPPPLSGAAPIEDGVPDDVPHDVELEGHDDPDAEGRTLVLPATPALMERHPVDRLDRWLARVLDDAIALDTLEVELDGPPPSRSRLKALIIEGRIAIDGATITDPSRLVQDGARVEVTLPPPEPAEPIAQDIPLSVVFEDAHLIVVDKPAGMTVHPAPGHPDGTLVNALLGHCGDSLSGIGGVRRPGIVHRIDKDTSGLLVVAKTDAAHAGLSVLFATHDIDRTYLALAWGSILPTVGRIETDLGRNPNDRKRIAVRPEGRGKHAITHYKVIETFGATASLVECRLETGRTHQIRVHMGHIGHPLVGDPVYARGRSGKLGDLEESTRTALMGFPRQALHAASLGFVHPVTGEELFFEAPTPQDLSSVIKSLRADTATR